MDWSVSQYPSCGGAAKDMAFASIFALYNCNIGTPAFTMGGFVPAMFISDEETSVDTDPRSAGIKVIPGGAFSNRDA